LRLELWQGLAGAARSGKGQRLPQASQEDLTTKDTKDTKRSALRVTVLKSPIN